MTLPQANIGAVHPKNPEARLASPDSGKLFCVALRIGRLANRLALFANFIAMAEEQRHRVVNVTFHSYAHLFESTRRDIYCRYPAPRRRSVLDIIPGMAPALRKTRLLYHLSRGVAVMNRRRPLLGQSVITQSELPGVRVTSLEGPEFQARIHPARIVFVYGWAFRAPTWVRAHADKIRAYFRPVETCAAASRAIVEDLRRGSDLVVGVHLRQGDYRTWNHGKCFFPVERYAAWMRQFADQFPGKRLSFLVCSDEPRRPEEFPGLKVVFGPGPPVVDLYALAECDYIFGPLSTFSQWSSFYGNRPLLQLRDAGAQVVREQFSVSFLDEVP